MNKITIGSLIFTVLALGGMVALLTSGTTLQETAVDPNGPTNIRMVDGKQVIQVQAKGGYAPRNTIAKANTPSVLNVTTNDTFDCSSALSIPTIGFRKALPSSGTTPIEIPPQPAGTTLKGICAMGMYHFAVQFQ